MSNQLEWLVQNRVIEVTITAEVTVDDLYDIMPQVNQSLEDGTPPVHLIFNLEAVANFPTDIQDTYKAFRPILRERIGFFIVITQDNVLQYITSTTCRLIGLRWCAYPATADAINFLTRLDDSLDWGTEHSSC